MAKKLLLVLGCLVSVSKAAVIEGRIGVFYNKFTTLIFPEDIVDVEAGSSEYHVKVKGKYLLLRAKHKKVAPTSLFVRYGKRKQCYVVEIFPDQQGPLQHYIVEKVSSKEREKQESNANPIDSIFSNDEQEYFTLGIRENGVEIILTNILHVDQVTYLKFFIKNKASIPYSVAHYSFEYVTFLGGFFFFKKQKKKQVDAILLPPLIHLPAKCGTYFIFAIPGYASEGGLEVLFGENDGERVLKLFIPSTILLNAKRK